MRAIYVSQQLQWNCHEPLATFSVKNGLVQMTDAYGKPLRVGKRVRGPAVLALLEEWTHTVFTQLHAVFSQDHMGLPFLGGPIGFFSYEFGMELLEQKCRHDDDLQTPDVFFFIPSQVYCHDFQTKERFFIGWGTTSDAARSALHAAKDRVVRSESLSSSIAKPKIFAEMDQSTYDDGIRRIKEYLKSGDTYQVNFAQRFAVEDAPNSALIFQRLFARNPSPHMFFYKTPEWSVISNSPEQLLHVWQKDSLWHAATRPIKGTVPRGKDTVEDEKQAQKLLQSEKDAAELVMIVDLCRNDLGQIAQAGTVKVLADRALEPYSYVWHTVATIQCLLQDGMTSFDAIRALFPGGSVTGCPKYRTVQIIDHLEPVRRGVYTGSAGYIDFRGGCDFNILIRTIWQRGDRARFHVGGGVVFDSSAAGEYAETIDKARAIVDALIV